MKKHTHSTVARSTGDLAALSIAWGSLLGAIVGGMLGLALGGAAFGLTTGGIGLLVGGFLGSVVTLFIWLFKKNNYSSAQSAELKAHEEKVFEIQQQPLLTATALLSQLKTDYETVKLQSQEQELRMKLSLLVLSKHNAYITDKKRRLDTVTRVLDATANHAKKRLHTRLDELRKTNEAIKINATELNAAQIKLTGSEAQLHETVEKMKQSEAELAAIVNMIRDTDSKKPAWQVHWEFKHKTAYEAQIASLKKRVTTWENLNEEIIHETTQSIHDITVENRALKTHRSPRRTR